MGAETQKMKPTEDYASENQSKPIQSTLYTAGLWGRRVCRGVSAPNWPHSHYPSIPYLGSFPFQPLVFLLSRSHSRLLTLVSRTHKITETESTNG